jgi:ketosteroid isomerase-like protein
MENTSKESLLSRSDNSTAVDSAQTITTPHFDEESIQRARPAVPLVEIKARRFWRLALILICGSSLVGAVMAIAFSRYQARSAAVSPPAASVAPSEKPENQSYEPLSESVATPEKSANDAPPAVASERNAEATRASRTREGRAAGEQPLADRDDSDSRESLEAAFGEWIAATNARNLQRHMDFYNQTVNAFYLTRNVPREAVRAEKSRVFSHADLVDIKAAAPGISMSPDGRTATMRFRKKYAIQGGGEDRRGEVVQELRWRRTGDGWKIISERDLRVIH